MSEPTNLRDHRTAGRGLAARQWWPWARRLLNLAFLGVVAWLLVTQARTVRWDEVLATMRQRPAGGLLGAAALAAASFALYSCFDLLGRAYTGHRLGRRQVMIVNFISYAFNLNLGSVVGGIAFRYRLYSRLGLGLGVITRVASLSMLTNWLGYVLLAGLVFWWWPFSLPTDWKLNLSVLHALGVALFVAAAAYLLVCALARQRTWTVHGHEIVLPSPRLAFLQLTMSSINWLLIAGVLYVLLDSRIPYAEVLGVLLVSAIAGVITHIPGGLGVLEAVFVALLSHRLPRNEVLAAVLLYRTIYYLIPLAAAIVLYLVVEARAKGGGRAAGSES